MIVLYCLLQLSLIVPGDAELTRQRWNTSEDNVYIIVDSSLDLDLTITRWKNLAKYVIPKSDTPISLIAPFQQKVLRCLNVSSTQELLAYLVEFKVSNQSPGTDVPTLKDALTFTFETIKQENGKEDESSIIIAWFSDYCGNCQEIIQSLVHVNFNLVIKNCLIVVPCPGTALMSIVSNLIGNDIEFDLIRLESVGKASVSYFISINLFRKCPGGWLDLRIKNSVLNLKCYKIDISPVRLNWMDASKQCNQLFSELPTLETDEELQFLKTTLNHATNDAAPQTSSVYIGLTKTSVGQNALQWTNQRPFVSGRRIESKNDDDKCVVLKYSVFTREKHEAVVKKDDITWELVDCNKNMTKIVLCEREIGNRLFRASQPFQPDSRELKEQMSLNKEFIVDVKKGEIFSRVKQYRSIETRIVTDYKDLLFDCEDGADRIVYSKVCNSFTDCSNGRDEAYCAVSNICQQSDFLCVNPNENLPFPLIQRISIVKKCNIYQDCPDNSDEEGCDECAERRCSDGTCVPSHWLTRDGEECSLYNNSSGHTFINITVERLTTKHHEVVNCNQLEDFNPIYKLPYNKGTYDWAPRCLFLRGRSGQPIGCNDMSHLQDCGNFTCAEEFIKCHESYCIPFHLINDGVMDCPHGEDEEEYTFYNKSGYFICNSDKHNFIHPVHVCDGVAQCPHGDDELNCNVTCPPGFKCFGSAVMVNNVSEVEQMKSFRMFDIQTKFLKLSGLDLSQLRELYILPNLLELHASNCNLTTLEFILGSKLKSSFYYLDLSYNKFTSIDDFGYKDFENLHFLNLTGNINLNFLHLFFRGLSKFKQLDLSVTNISSLPFKAIKVSSALRYLNVANTKIESLEIMYIYKIRVLDFLNIHNTCLKESDTVNLLSNLTITTALYVDHFKYCCPQVVGNRISKHVCHAPFDGISSCEDLIGDILKRSLLWLAVLMSLVGNIMVLAFRIRYDRGMLKKGYGVFVTNLGIADFIMGVYLTIIASMDIYFRDNYVLHETDWSDSVLCKISGFLSTLSSETSSFFVLLITLERFLVIRFPFGDCRLSKWVIILLVVTSWIIGFTLALIPILFPQWTIYSSNGMCIGLPLTTDQQHGWQYPFGVFIVFNCVCFLFIAFGQVLIFISMSNQRLIVNTLNASRRQQDINVAKQLFIVAMSNFLCWFPICVTGLMSLNGSKVSPDSYAWFVIFVLPLNAAINPMIYTIPAIFKKWIAVNSVKQSSM